MIFMKQLSIEDHDRIFWFGDLNYRIDTTLGQDTLKMLVNEDRRKDMLAFDQLIKQQRETNVFVGYNEGEITFDPTYKYDIGTSEFDTGNCKRPPAWTDRILWKGNHIDQIQYRSHPSFKVSDHKPVSAIFQTGVTFINEEKKHKILNDLFINFTNLEYKHLPRVRISSTDPLLFNILHFGLVKFNEPVNKQIIIENISVVPLNFRFKRKISEMNSTSKPWLSVLPLNGTISPGEKCHLDVQICVTEETAREITLTGDINLSDVLMMRIPYLTDYFLTVTGEYERSSFGSKIDALCRMTLPFKSLTMSEIRRLEGIMKEKGDDVKNNIISIGEERNDEINENEKENISCENEEDESQILDIPKEISSLCLLLKEKNCFEVKDLFQTSGSQTDFSLLREWIDSNPTEQGPAVSIHSVADALLKFLNSLCEPIIPFEFFNLCIENSSDFNETQKILALLPVSNKKLFNYIRQFLHQVLRHWEASSDEEKVLAKIFGEIVLREKGCVECKVTEKNACRTHGTSALATTTQNMIKNQMTQFMFHFLRCE